MKGKMKEKIKKICTLPWAVTDNRKRKEEIKNEIKKGKDKRGLYTVSKLLSRRIQTEK